MLRLRSSCISTSSQARHPDVVAPLPPVPSTLAQPSEKTSQTLRETLRASKICVLCDDLFPEYPSQLLMATLQTVLEKAVPDPRPTNPAGMRVAMSVAICACDMHRAEMSIVPEGVVRGYPQQINFQEVRARVRRMQHTLSAIIEADDNDRGEFWAIARKDVKKNGALKANSIGGQFGTYTDSLVG